MKNYINKRKSNLYRYQLLLNEVMTIIFFISLAFDLRIFLQLNEPLVLVFYYYYLEES